MTGEQLVLELVETTEDLKEKRSKYIPPSSIEYYPPRIMTETKEDEDCCVNHDCAC